MSRKIGMDTICLRTTPRLAHTEYSMEYHTEFVKSYNGGFHDAWDYDFQWTVNDGPIDWGRQGRCTDMGHAAYAADGSDQHQSAASPFVDVEEVYEFDPAREYGLPGHRELVRFYEDWYQKAQAGNPGQVITGGYYKTLVSGLIQAFGWDMLLMAAADAERFAGVVERFGRYTAHYMAAWADTSVDVVIQHDDIVWTQGPFLHPDFYRSVMFPLYTEMWEPLKKAGKKILYCSDGTFDMFMNDIAACGADGFIFEPSNNLDSIVERFGRTHCLVGSKVDCRTMSFGTWEQVKAEIDKTIAL
ncbi:MAG: uroporphyrinogen decarboxylase family protein, partial [bacterium]